MAIDTGSASTRLRIRRPSAISLAGLLLSFFKVGSVGFGGGMAVIAMMEREFVQKRKLLSVDEFLHGAGLGQILGSFAVNAAFFVGYRLFGAAGGLLSSSAFLLPSVILVTALSHFYFRYHSIPALQSLVLGLGPVVIALILNAGWCFGRQVLRSPLAIGIGAAALAAGILKTNAAWVIVAAGGIGLLVPVVRRPTAADGSEHPSGLLRALHIPLTLSPVTLIGSTATIFLKIGLVFFGGGFVLVPVLHHRMVTELGWLSPREFLDGVAISNLTPGPIAVLATFAGYHVAGIAGALVATASLLAPGLGLMWIMSGQYERFRDNPRAQRFLAGVNPAVTGLILSAAVLLGASAILSWRGWVLCALSLVLLARFRWHPAFVLLIGSVAGYLGVLP